MVKLAIILDSVLDHYVLSRWIVIKFVCDYPNWHTAWRGHGPSNFHCIWSNCGTCHMTSFFSPLPGKTTAAICPSSNLLVATFTQQLASHPKSGSLLTTSSPLPSPLTVTSHLRSEGTTSLLALLLISIHDAFLTTNSLLPSHLSEGSHHEYFKLSHTHQIILKLWKYFIAEMEF